MGESKTVKKKNKKSKRKKKNKGSKDVPMADAMSQYIGSTSGMNGKQSMTHQNPFLLEEVHKVWQDLSQGKLYHT